MEEPISGFDCVLHDLNFVEVRINYLPQVLAATAHAGVLILDDVHKPDYLYQVLEKLKHESVTVYNLKPATRDSFNRFALAVLKIEHAGKHHYSYEDRVAVFEKPWKQLYGQPLTCNARLLW